MDENGQLVGKYCGKIAPSPVVSSGNQLFIKFVSDYETHGAGFSIRYEVFKTGGWNNISVMPFHILYKVVAECLFVIVSYIHVYFVVDFTNMAKCFMLMICLCILHHK